MIVIVDYGVGNLGSILNILRRISSHVIISSKPEEINKAEKLILPGVGSFDNGMSRLNGSELLPLLNEKVLGEKTPILGICLGMQLFTTGSEEGNLSGLGWINASTQRFSFSCPETKLRIPHMGWNWVSSKRCDALWAGFEDVPRFYFAHSYHIVCNDPEEIAGSTWYGYDFTSVIRKDNICGMQFHPEKSHRFGIKILKNFVDLV